VCVCSLIYPARKTNAPYYTAICGLSDSTIFIHIFSQETISGKNYIKIKCAFRFCIETLREIFLIPRRIPGSAIINVLYIGLHVKYLLFLWDFNETWIFSTFSKKKHKYEISWKSFQWEPSCSMRTDGPRDMKKLIVDFHIFAKAPKIEGKFVSSPHSSLMFRNF
jgi:hypothetical protein